MGYDEKDLFSPRVYFLVKIPPVSKFFPGRACIIGIQIIATATASLKSPTRRGVYTFLSLIFFFSSTNIYIYYSIQSYVISKIRFEPNYRNFAFITVPQSRRLRRNDENIFVRSRTITNRIAALYTSSVQRSYTAFGRMTISLLQIVCITRHTPSPLFSRGARVFARDRASNFRTTDDT